MNFNWWTLAVFICAIPAFLFALYLIVRVITCAAFRSWWEAKEEIFERLGKKNQQQK